MAYLHEFKGKKATHPDLGGHFYQDEYGDWMTIVDDKEACISSLVARYACCDKWEEYKEPFAIKPEEFGIRTYKDDDDDKVMLCGLNLEGTRYVGFYLEDNVWIQHSWKPEEILGYCD